MSRVPPTLSDSERNALLRDMGLDADRNPLTLTAEEKSAAALPGLPAPSQEPQMPDTLAPQTSPTGTPVVPPAVTKVVFPILLAIFSAIALGQPDILPDTQVDQQIATLLVGIIGWLSPGLRKAS